MPVLADFGISFFSPDRGDCPITDNPDDYVIHDTDTRYPPVSSFLFSETLLATISNRS